MSAGHSPSSPSAGCAPSAVDHLDRPVEPRPLDCSGGVAPYAEAEADAERLAATADLMLEVL